MSDAIKVWGAEEDLLNTDLNAEFAHVYASITAQSVGAASSVTPDLLSDGANPEVFFAELFEDGRVLTAATDLIFITSSGLNVTVSAGTAYVLETSADPVKLVRVDVPSVTVLTMAPSTTNFIDLKVDGTFDVNANGTPAADFTRLMSVVTDATTVTANTDLADREFPENNPLFPFSFANLVVDVSTINTVTLESGSIFRDKNNIKTITTTSNLTADIEGTVGLNALDQGTESADTWYAFLHLRDPLGALPDGTLLVAEINYPDAIVLPSGYTDALIRRVNWVRNNTGSDFILGLQADGIVKYNDEQQLSTNFTSVNFTDIDASAFIPSSSRMGNLSAEETNTGVSLNTVLFFTRAGITAATGGFQVQHMRTNVGGASVDVGFTSISDVFLDSSQAFAARTTGGTVNDIWVNGYKDILAD